MIPSSSIFSGRAKMTELLTYGRMAEAHWREHGPRRVRELDRTGQLMAALREAQQWTLDEMARLMRGFRRQGLNPQQARDQAWELVRERYRLIRPETPAT